MNIDPAKKDVPKNMYMRSIRSSGVGNRPPRKKKKMQIASIGQGGRYAQWGW